MRVRKGAAGFKTVAQNSSIKDLINVAALWRRAASVCSRARILDRMSRQQSRRKKGKSAFSCLIVIVTILIITIMTIMDIMSMFIANTLTIMMPTPFYSQTCFNALPKTQNHIDKTALNTNKQLQSYRPYQ